MLTVSLVQSTTSFGRDASRISLALCDSLSAIIRRVTIRLSRIAIIFEESRKTFYMIYSYKHRYVIN